MVGISPQEVARVVRIPQGALRFVSSVGRTIVSKTISHGFETRTNRKQNKNKAMM